MSATALQIYWSQIKSFTKNNWKYAVAFGIGSFVSAIFSFLFAKSITGKNTSELIFSIIIENNKRKYRNIINYDGFSTSPTPIRPSTANIAWDALLRNSMGKTARLTMNYTTTAKEFKAQFMKSRTQNLKQRGVLGGLPSFVKDPKEIIIKPKSANNSGPLKAYLTSYPGASNENGVIFYIHGGGFYLGYPDQGYPALMIMSQYLGMNGLAIDYHYCPEISIPQQVDECIEAYKYILFTLKVDSKKVFIVGDSAGGTLTLLVLQKLNELKLPQPCGGIPISALCDCSWKTALKCEQEDGIQDAMFAVMPKYMDICIDNVDRKEYEDGDDDERDRILKLGKYSPLNGNWKGLCPLYISASYNEVFINDNKLIVNKCKQYNVDYECDFDPYLLHVTVLWCASIPEARDKLIIMIEWMKKQLHTSR